MSELQNNIEVNSMLPVGTLLQGGKYRIERYLSSGGFGNTYVATNIEFDEQVAIKEFFIRGINQRDSDTCSVSVSNIANIMQFVSQKEKFCKEARRLRKLHSNHIVTVHDLFEENGTSYYEMDLIEGESLNERLKHRGKPLSEEETVIILDQMLDAISVIHAQGLYHLDMKPANIMINKKGHAILIDFGASKQMWSDDGNSISTSSTLAFTPGYAPLELLEQDMKSIGPWTDIYSLGATLYKLVTNLTPPTASDLLISQIPLTFPTQVSLHMQQLIAWMMKPTYVERPQGAADVKAFLEKGKGAIMTIDREEITDDTQLDVIKHTHAKTIKIGHNTFDTRKILLRLSLVLVAIIFAVIGISEFYSSKNDKKYANSNSNVVIEENQNYNSSRHNEIEPTLNITTNKKNAPIIVNDETNDAMHRNLSNSLMNTKYGTKFGDYRNDVQQKNTRNSSWASQFIDANNELATKRRINEYNSRSSSFCRSNSAIHIDGN